MPPTKAVIVSGERVRILRERRGPFYVTWHTPDPAGNAVVVDLHEGAKVRRTAVRVRELRGPWRATLAATGRTEAGVKAHDALLHEVATSGRPITGGDLLRVAANNEGLGDGAFAHVAPAVDGRPIL